MTAREIIVDSFAGGGGASTGIEMALGVSPDIAINHDAVALAMHAANHPITRHLPHNIWKVDPVEACAGRPVGLLWASPDCKHFSKAKGAKPVEKRIRDLAWVVVRWAKQVSPRIIILENVEEFATWGPLAANGRPCPDRKGMTFRLWVGQLRKLGYRVDWRELRACDYGAPTIRKRLFLIARRDGKPIVWPRPSHGDPKSDDVKAGRLKPWRPAAEIIDWSLPCPSIFATAAEIMAQHGLRAQRPLKPNTLARIAKGVFRYVINCADPFIVPSTHSGDVRVNGIGDPLPTQTTAHRGEHALVTPFVTKFNRGATGHDAREPLHTITAAASATHPGGACPLGLVAPVLVKNNFGDKPISGANEPVRTICTGNNHLLVTAFLAQHNYEEPGHDARDPLSTIVGKGCTQAVVSAGLLSLKGTDRRAGAIEAPAPAITAQGGHLAELRAFLIKYYGTGGQLADPCVPMHTDTAQDRFGIVMVRGEAWRIADIGMRMLNARERFNAQGFPSTYIINLLVPRRNKKTGATDMVPITGDQQGRMCGNSVSPVMAEALVRANFAPREIEAPAVPEFRLEAVA